MLWTLPIRFNSGPPLLRDMYRLNLGHLSHDDNAYCPSYVYRDV